MVNDLILKKLFNNLWLFQWGAFILGYLVFIVSFPIFLDYFVSDYVCWSDIIIGPVAAAFVMFYCFFFSPGYTDKTIILGFVIGCFIAIFITPITTYPECHPRAYEFTYMPFLFSFLSGGSMAMVCWSKSKK